MDTAAAVLRWLVARLLASRRRLHAVLRRHNGPKGIRSPGGAPQFPGGLCGAATGSSPYGQKLGRFRSDGADTCLAAQMLLQSLRDFQSPQRPTRALVGRQAPVAVGKVPQLCCRPKPHGQKLGRLRFDGGGSHSETQASPRSLGDSQSLQRPPGALVGWRPIGAAEKAQQLCCRPKPLEQKLGRPRPGNGAYGGDSSLSVAVAVVLCPPPPKTGPPD